MWACERCTYENQENATNCNICGGPKQVSMPTIHDPSALIPRSDSSPQPSGSFFRSVLSSFSSSSEIVSQSNGDGQHSVNSTSSTCRNETVHKTQTRPSETESIDQPPSSNPTPRTTSNQLLPESNPLILMDDEDIYSSVAPNNSNTNFTNTPKLPPALNNVAQNRVEPMQIEHNSSNIIPMSNSEDLNFVEDHFNISSDLWKCSRCTFENPLSASECNVCCNKPYAVAPNGMNLNDYLQRVENPKPISIEVHPNNSVDTLQRKAFVDNEFSSWNCPQCTLLNKTSTTCQACGYLHPQFNSQQNREPATSNHPTTSNAHLPSANIEMHNMEEATSIILQSIERQDIVHGCISMEKQRMTDEKYTMEVVKKVQVYCKREKLPFVDDRFPPVDKSLYFPKSKQKTNLQWRRPYYLTTKHGCSLNNWTVYNNPQPSDIKQGILGNCWFLSGLAVLAERPELLKNVLITKELNEEGIYVVRLCISGKWQVVFVDDNLPCDKDGYLVYSQARRNQLWVPLIEKALAKLHGCYEALQAGRSLEGLATLTGAPCESLQLSKSDFDSVDIDEGIVWAKLLSSMEAGFLMGASCGGGNMTNNESEYQEKGLRPRHAYSVLNVAAVKAISGPVRLIQLRNPWGQYSWKGDWSDGSNQWKDNPMLKNHLNPYHSQDGTFWMNLEDMIKYFDCVDICKIYGREWVSMRVSGVFPSKASDPVSGFYLTVFQSSELEFCLFQQLERSQFSANRYPVDSCIAIFRANKSDGKYMLGSIIQCSNRQVKKQVYCNYFLEQGTYLVICFAFNHWLSGFVTGNRGQRTIDESTPRLAEYILVLHSSKPVELDKVANVETTLSRIILKIAANKGENKSLRDGVTCYVLSRGWAGLIAVIENRDPYMSFHVKCDCMESTNVVSTRGRFITADSIPPLHSQVIVVLSQLDSYSGFSITHKLTHRLSQMLSLKDWAPPRVQHAPIIPNELINLHEPVPL